MGTITTQVAGVTFKNADGIDRQDILRTIKKRDSLYLRDESTEKYPEAIGVYDMKDRKLGFIPKSDAQEIRKHLYEDGQLEALHVTVKSVGSGDGVPIGCSISISHSLLGDDNEIQSEPLWDGVKHAEIEKDTPNAIGKFVGVFFLSVLILVICWGALAIYQHAMEDKAAKEATEAMIETAEKWKNTQAKTIYD